MYMCIYEVYVYFWSFRLILICEWNKREKAIFGQLYDFDITISKTWKEVKSEM